MRICDQSHAVCLWQCQELNLDLPQFRPTLSMLDSLLTPPLPSTHPPLQEGVGKWTQAYFIFFTRNPVNQLLMRKCRIMHMHLFKTQNAERHFLLPVLYTLHEMNLLGTLPSTNITNPTILTMLAVLSDTLQRLKIFFIQEQFFFLLCASGGLITGLIPTSYLALVTRTVQNSPINEKRKTLRISRL